MQNYIEKEVSKEHTGMSAEGPEGEMTKRLSLSRWPMEETGQWLQKSHLLRCPALRGCRRQSRPLGGGRGQSVGTFALEPVGGGGEQEPVGHGLGATAAGDAGLLVPRLHPL